jgi:hypothetical protein
MNCVLLIPLVMLSFGIAAASKPEFFVHWAINAGGKELLASDKIMYGPGVKRQDDVTEGHPIDLISPRDAPLFLNIFEDEESFDYKVSVPREGNFLLVIKWAEIDEYVHSGDRIMDVVLNGKHKVIRNLDIFKRVGSFAAHFEYVYFSIIDNKLYYKDEVSRIEYGKITIDFVKNKGKPFVSAMVLFEGKVEVIPRLPWTIQQKQNKCVIKVAKEKEHHNDQDSVDIKAKIKIFYNPKTLHSLPGYGKVISVEDLLRNATVIDTDDTTTTTLLEDSDEE